MKTTVQMPGFILVRSLDVVVLLGRDEERLRRREQKGSPGSRSTLGGSLRVQEDRGLRGEQIVPGVVEDPGLGQLVHQVVEDEPVRL